jgi:hypothetical protein
MNPSWRMDIIAAPLLATASVGTGQPRIAAAICTNRIFATVTVGNTIA